MDRTPKLKNLKISEILAVFFIFLCTLVIFYLDIFVGSSLSFYVFYFPSIAAVAWYFGRNACWPMVFLCSVLWFLKQWDLGIEGARVTTFWNGFICVISFCAICWMTLAIRSREEDAERKSLELEQFAFRAAHELKSPTTNISGYTQLLDEKFKAGTDQEAKGLTENILKNVKRMTVMIKELLDYARAGSRDVLVLPTDLGKVLKETLEGFSFEISEKKAEILADPLPFLAVEPALAGLLFQNLIGNALKYCEREPRIHIGAVRKGKEWLFSVRDNGIGVSKKDQKRIFVMFEKATTHKDYPGSGIGLATCQKIVERYHGRIWIESPPKSGEGSVFYFTLPALKN